MVISIMDLKKRVLENISEFDYLILTLFYINDSEAIRDDLFFQKELFLIVNFIKEMEPIADFIPHILGPYSEPAEISLANLTSVNLIEKSPSNFHLTEFGKDVSKEVIKKIPDYKLDAIKDFKALLNNLTKDELLVFTYFSFPKMTTESGIYSDVKKNRIASSISLYGKGKVSLEKATFLSGLPMSRFVELVGV